MAPDNLDTKRVAELAELFESHLDPKPSKTVCRFKFNSCSRKVGELAAEYVVHLCQVEKDCDSGGTFNDMLTDRLVCGVNDEKMQLKLFTGKDALTFENAMELALAMEVTSKNAENLGAGITDTNASVNAVKHNSRTTKGECFS